MANIDLYGLVTYNFQASESKYLFPQNCSSLQCHALAMITYNICFAEKNGKHLKLSLI